ncbi:MAG: tetratricopeptide repeat protein [Treponema sp.]|jgi:tetratricopeptide (TPR) repeat protein|nr:tetratricopeptide repeat protein [Treponema sp.]
MRKILFFVLPVLLLALPLGAQDFSLRPRVFGLFPLGGKSPERYKTGVGGDIAFDFDISGVLGNPLGLGYTGGVEGGYGMAPINDDGGNNLSFVSGAGNLSLYYYPLSRLMLRADGSLGVFRGGDGQMNAPPGLFWRAGVEAGFRFNPAFTVSLNGGFRSYNDGYQDVPLVSGLYAGITAQINLERGANAGNIDVEIIQENPVFPVFQSLYRSNPAAILRVRNDESAEIRNVRVSFRAGRYTSSEFVCGIADLIGKRKTRDFYLYADFSPDLLNFTENSRVSGEAVIRYTLLGKEKEAVLNAAVEVYNRNAFPSGDKTGLVVFVSPNSPEILEYSKYLIGMARSERRMGLNQNMRHGIWLFEGIKAGKFTLRERAASSGGAGVEEFQFPAQTLAYRSGSSADLGLLYAGALEAAGIPAAFIPLDDDFIVAACLKISPSMADLLFNGLDMLLVIGGEVWLPLSMKGENYTAAWTRGAEKIREIEETEEGADFIIMEETWALYPPAELPSQGIRPVRADETGLRAAAAGAVDQYIKMALLPQESKLRQQIAAAPGSELYNRLGIILASLGNLGEAKSVYEQAAYMGSVSAMSNRAAVAFLEKDYAGAERWFREVLARRPADERALGGLRRIEESRGGNKPVRDQGSGDG